MGIFFSWNLGKNNQNSDGYELNCLLEKSYRMFPERGRGQKATPIAIVFLSEVSMFFGLGNSSNGISDPS